MSRSIQLTALVVVIVLAGASCVSTPVSAPSDGQVVINANPSTIVLDEFSDPAITEGSTLVTAQIFDANGTPSPSVTVMFETDGGSLASAPPGQPARALETDDDGFVSDTLTVQLGDPDSITVSIRSGTLTGSVVVNKQENAANQAPVPDIVISPPDSATLNETVLFDGTGTADPDGDTITCYQWQIETGANISPPPLVDCIPANSRCEIEQGSLAAVISRFYDTEQVLVATLRVTDDPNVNCSPSGPAEPASSFNAITAASYAIVCDNTPPIAVGGPDQNVVLGSGGTVVVTLDGSASNDPESGITSYSWNCGNGVVDSRAVASCLYNAVGNYNALLTVTNGCGQIDTEPVIVRVN